MASRRLAVLRIASRMLLCRILRREPSYLVASFLASFSRLTAIELAIVGGAALAAVAIVSVLVAPGSDDAAPPAIEGVVGAREGNAGGGGGGLPSAAAFVMRSHRS